MPTRRPVSGLPPASSAPAPLDPDDPDEPPLDDEPLASWLEPVVASSSPWPASVPPLLAPCDGVVASSVPVAPVSAAGLPEAPPLLLPLPAPPLPVPPPSSPVGSNAESEPELEDEHAASTAARRPAAPKARRGCGRNVSRLPMSARYAQSNACASSDHDTKILNRCGAALAGPVRICLSADAEILAHPARRRASAWEASPSPASSRPRASSDCSRTPPRTSANRTSKSCGRDEAGPPPRGDRSPTDTPDRSPSRSPRP